MPDNIKPLVDHTKDNRHWSTEQMLESTLAELKSGEIPHPRALIIFLDDKNDAYTIKYRACNISLSQISALLSVTSYNVNQEIMGE